MPLSVPSCFFLGLLLALSTSLAVNPSRGIELRTGEKGTTKTTTTTTVDLLFLLFYLLLFSFSLVLVSPRFPRFPRLPNRCLVTQMTDVQWRLDRRKTDLDRCRC